MVKFRKIARFLSQNFETKEINMNTMYRGVKSL